MKQLLNLAFVGYEEFWIRRILQISRSTDLQVDDTLRDLQNSSYPLQPHSIIAKYFVRNGLTSSGNVCVYFTPCIFICMHSTLRIRVPKRSYVTLINVFRQFSLLKKKLKDSHAGKHCFVISLRHLINADLKCLRDCRCPRQNDKGS